MKIWDQITLQCNIIIDLLLLVFLLEIRKVALTLNYLVYTKIEGTDNLELQRLTEKFNIEMNFNIFFILISIDLLFSLLQLLKGDQTLIKLKTKFFIYLLINFSLTFVIYFLTMYIQILAVFWSLGASSDVPFLIGMFGKDLITYYHYFLLVGVFILLNITVNYLSIKRRQNINLSESDKFSVMSGFYRILLLVCFIQFLWLFKSIISIFNDFYDRGLVSVNLNLFEFSLLLIFIQIGQNKENFPSFIHIYLLKRPFFNHKITRLNDKSFRIIIDLIFLILIGMFLSMSLNSNSEYEISLIVHDLTIVFSLTFLFLGRILSNFGQDTIPKVKNQFSFNFILKKGHLMYIFFKSMRMLFLVYLTISLFLLPYIGSIQYQETNNIVTQKPMFIYEFNLVTTHENTITGELISNFEINIGNTNNNNRLLLSFDTLILFYYNEVTHQISISDCYAIVSVSTTNERTTISSDYYNRTRVESEQNYSTITLTVNGSTTNASNVFYGLGTIETNGEKQFCQLITLPSKIIWNISS